MQANERIQVKTRPTPIASDVILRERRDAVMPRHMAPEYGTPHPNKILWPNHRLSLVIPDQNDPTHEFWFYSANRLNQESYNYSHSMADIGNQRFDTVTRSLVIPRADWNDSLRSPGEPMVMLPEGVFSEDYVLSSVKTGNAQEEQLQSLYITEESTYVRRTTTRAVQTNNGVVRELTTLYHRGEMVTVPLPAVRQVITLEVNEDNQVAGNGEIFLRVSIPGLIVPFDIPVYLTDGAGAFAIADAVRMALFGDPSVSGFTQVGGTGRVVTLTLYAAGANIPGAYFSFENGAAVSVLFEQTSTITTPGSQAGLGPKPIESVFTDPPPMYFGEQSNGVVRDGQQLTTNWFSLTEREPYAHGPEYYGVRKNRELGALVPYITQVVPAPAFDDLLLDPNVTYEPIDAARSRKVTEFAPIEVMENYHMSFPSRAGVRIPPVLISARIIWNKGQGGGSGYSDTPYAYATGESRELSVSERAEASGSASLMPELATTVQEYNTDNLPSTAHFFFMPLEGISEQAIRAKLSILMNRPSNSPVLPWPVFLPQQHEVVLTGEKNTQSINVGGSASLAVRPNGGSGHYSISRGASGDANPMTRVVTIPATIHPAMSIQNASHPDIRIPLEAKVQWYGDNNGFPGMNQVDTVVITASGSVFPTSIPATSPPSVPSSGIYLINSKVEYYDYGYVKIFAETMDASVIGSSSPGGGPEIL
jgi:hypothetical protein